MPYYSPTEPPRIYPTFRYRDPHRMIDWLELAFGFKLRAKYEGDGIVHHAEMAFGSSLIMLGTVRNDEYGAMVGMPDGTSAGKSTYVAAEEVDGLCERARAAGATILQEPIDRDYGSREFICRDPEGHVWSFGTYWPKASEPAG